ncbi:MAG: hypothetical protein QXI16_05960 [Sulfolobaceae archaeon]
MDEHEVKEDIQIDIYYPDHPPRKESELFRKSRQHLIDELDTPCFICGSKEDRELHHYYVEWAEADAIDWNGKIRTDHPNFDWSKFKSPEDFVDSEYNMMVLCKKHHRLKDHGIHMMPYPNWIIQKYIRSDFVYTPSIYGYAPISQK